MPAKGSPSTRDHMIYRTNNRQTNNQTNRTISQTSSTINNLKLDQLYNMPLNLIQTISKTYHSIASIIQSHSTPSHSNTPPTPHLLHSLPNFFKITISPLPDATQEITLQPVVSSSFRIGILLSLLQLTPTQSYSSSPTKKNILNIILFSSITKPKRNFSQLKITIQLQQSYYG